MKSFPDWQYDELKQVGTDYTDLNEVQAYDSRMQKLRDIQSETAAFMDAVGLTSDQTVLEIGTGTGELALEIARHCAKVFAIDVSPVMLQFAEQKASDQGITNIEFHHGGFLTYNHKGKPFDVIVSQLALHHLPDFWKLVALKRIYAMLRGGGKFYLKDTVYSFKGDHSEFFENWIKGIKETAGEELARDSELSVKSEYSTLDWVMEGLIKRTEFVIERADYKEGFLAVYLCIKE